MEVDDYFNKSIAIKILPLRFHRTYHALIIYATPGTIINLISVQRTNEVPFLYICTNGIRRTYVFY